MRKLRYLALAALAGAALAVARPIAAAPQATAGAAVQPLITEPVIETELATLANGIRRIANISDPRIPAALVPAAVGIVSLNDFHPRAQYSLGNGAYRVVPADLATIYNFNPLFSGGLSGQGQTIALIEDTDLFAASDWSTFRSTFGLWPMAARP
jgi:subtilase family serine protease